MPHYFWVDSIRLKQIINLLANAVKFTEKGFVKLDISILKTANSKTTIRFAVLDSGRYFKGKPNKNFKAFSEEDSSTTKKIWYRFRFDNFKQIIELMESHLQLSSEIELVCSISI
jgi:K+-sensing histidine kinase KdpD